MDKTKIISQEERLVLIRILDKSIIKMRFWNRKDYSIWGNRLNRLIHYHYKYLLFLLSKIYPFTLSIKTFFNLRLFFKLPEHYYFLMSGFFPEIDDTCESPLTKFLIKYLQPGDVFFDIGANNGLYTLLSRFLVGPGGQVHAFEPTPSSFNLLKKNATNFRNVYVNNLAIYSKKGHIDFYLNKFSVGNTIKVSSYYNVKDYKKTMVETISLDEYCSMQSIVPTFIKIDVEGSEGDVIMGAQKILDKSKSLVAMELWKNDNQSHKNAFLSLCNLGYKPYWIDEFGDLVLVPSGCTDFNSCFKNSGSQVYENLIFKK